MERGSQLSKDDKEDKEDEEEEDEEEEEDQATDINSNNPHLAGGEKAASMARWDRGISNNSSIHIYI